MLICIVLNNKRITILQICYIRRGSHYGRFCWGLFTLGIKICRHTHFLMWPNVCFFSKKFKIWEKHQRRRYAWAGLADFANVYLLLLLFFHPDPQISGGWGGGLFRTRLISSPRYFEGRSNFLGFTLMFSVIYYQLFRITRYFELSVLSLHLKSIQPRYFELVKNRLRT